MHRFLCQSSLMNTLLDFLGVAGIIIFGSFIVIIVIDLILATTSDKEGLFFNKSKAAASTTPVDNSDAQVFTSQIADNVHGEPDFTNGDVVYYNDRNETPVTAIDFDKAVEEQQLLQSKLDEVPAMDNFYPEVVDEPIEEENIEAIALDVSKEAVRQLEAEAKQQAKKVYRMEEPIVEPMVEVLPVEVPNPNNEEIKRLEQERLELEKKMQEMNAEREKEKTELLKTIQELQGKEPVIIDKNKEEEERRRLANIAKMNSRLTRIKSNTKKIETKAKEEKVVKAVVEDLIPEEVEIVEETPVVETEVVEAPVVEEVKTEKPKFKKAYYENRLEVLEQELKEVQAELKQNKKDFGPLQKVYKTYEKDEAKLRRQEAIVAKQQININGVNRKSKISEEKKAKLDESAKQLKQLKESVYNCKQIIEQNKDRYPMLEKNNKLLTKQLKRLEEDIESVKEALKWYEEN